MAYQNGEVDFAKSLDTSVIKQYEGQDDLVMPGGVLNYYVELNTDDGTTCEALKDKDVRKALSEAVNRKEMCAALDASVVVLVLVIFMFHFMASFQRDFLEVQKAVTSVKKVEISLQKI